MIRMLLLALPLALSGCMVELLTTTAIQGELASQSAQAGMQALDHAKESKARTEAEYAIRAYQAEKGSYPPSLAALVPGFLPGVPAHADGSPFGYDPASGVLLDSPAAAPQITQADRDGLATLDKAVYAYWESTGLYPPSLAALIPTYLTNVPMTSAGEAFVYDAQTGAIYHPRQSGGVTAVPVARGGSGSAGVGALGEATAGIGIQNQLQNMNTSGVANTGSAVRRSAQGINSQHNQQQQQALDDLDQ